MSLFIVFVFFCLCSVLSIAFFFYGKQCGEQNAYGLHFTIEELELRVSAYERTFKTYDRKMDALRDVISKKEEEVNDFKALADTYVKESIQYYDRIKALEEELGRSNIVTSHNQEYVEVIEKRKPGRPRKTLPAAPLLNEAS